MENQGNNANAILSPPADAARSAGRPGAGLAVESPPVVADAALDESLAEGRVIVNPISGERIIIRVSGSQTDGKLLVFDLYLPPGAHVPARHVHPAQVEQFTVVAGQMRFRVGRFGGHAILAQPGATIRIPAGTAHWFGNPGPQMSQARVEVRPALRMEELFETTESLGLEDAGAFWLTRLANLARVVLEFQREVAVPDTPRFLVKLLLAPLAWLGRRRNRLVADRDQT